MNNYIHKRCYVLPYRILSAFVAFTFVTSAVMPPQMAAAQVIPTILNLPVPGTMVTPSMTFVPVLLKGMTIHPDDPLKFDFIIDSGNTDFDETRIKSESQRLVKYFLASMTIPKDDLWVNLSPYESNKIIPDELGKTELGRDMLAQDYILKQLTASLMYPEKELGKEFWNKVYKQAQEKFGTTEIPVDTFNKVWILPETATVYEHGQTVYIVDAKLKVMLDSDYEAMNQGIGDRGQGLENELNPKPQPPTPQVSTEIIREVILPEIEREVNEGRNFAPLRQIYHSLILAKWYKETIKNSLLSQIYVDQKKTAGVESGDETLKDQIYAQYMEAYKKGVFNYIKEDYDRLSNEIIPRKYFSGGIDRLTNFSLIKLDKTSNPARVVSAEVGKQFVLTTAADPQKSSVASPITPQEARALIEGKLLPEHHHIINDTHVQMAMAYEGDFEVVYHAGSPETIEITRVKVVTQSSSPVFMDEMKERAKELGIPLGDNTKIAVFIGSEQITASDHYYQMFKEVVRRNFKFDLVYLPFVIKEGAANSEERIQLIKEQLANNPRVIGATITRPWKERFFESGDNGIGAVNYILKDQNGQLRRMATDGPTWIDGLNDDLRAQKILEGPNASYDFQNKKIVILGSGGSARELADTLNGKLKGPKAKITFTDTDESKRTSLKETLDRLNPTYTTVFLAPDDLSNLRRAIREADILINATGVGRGETEGQSPLLPYLFAEARHDLIVSDLISNTDTQMLKDARETGPEGIKTFYGRSMYIRGMAHFIKGWMGQAHGGEQRIPSENELYRAIIQSEFTPKEIFQAAWPRFGYQERYYSNMGELIRKIADLKEEGKISKAVGQYEGALKAAIAFTETKIVPDVYVVDSGEESFGAEWMDKSFGLLPFEHGIYLERSLLDTIQQKGDPADMLTRVFVHVLTTGSISQKRKAQFEYAKAKFPRLIHHLLDPVNGGTKNIEEVLWDVRDNVLGLMKADHVRDSLGDIGVNYTVTLDKKKQQEIRRHGEELADIAESALHKIALNALNKTIDLGIYQRMHLKEHEMTDEDNFSIGTLAFAANPPTLAHALVAALKAMAESNSDIFYVSATFSDFRKPWLRTTYEKRQDISSDFFGMLSGGLIKVMPRIPHDDGLNGEEKVLPILDILDGAGSVKLWYGAGDDHYFAFAFKNGKVKFEEIVTEGNKRNYNDFAYYVNMPGYKKLLEKLLGEYRSTIPPEHMPMIEKIVQAKNPADVLAEALRKEEETPGEKKVKKEKVFFPVLDTVGKLWLIQDEVNRRKEAGQYTTNFTLGMINTLRLGVQKDDLRDSLDFPVQYNAGASFEIAATYLRNGVVKLIKDGEINLVLFEAMSKGLLKQLLFPTSEDREYLYSMVRLDKGLIAAKAVQTLFPVNGPRENIRHQKLMDQLKADLSAVVPDAVVDERLEGDISQITVSDAGRMKDLIQYTYSVHNGLYPDGRGKETVLVVNIRVGEDVSAQLKDDLLKAITRYVRAYNYAEDFWGLQDVLIKDLVRRDKQEGELSAEDVDVIMAPGNDDLSVYRKTLDLLSRGVGKYLLISGGRGRLIEDIKRAADANGFDVEMATEAEMIHSIMIQMAERNPQWQGLVADLRDDNVVILDKEARYTVENFQKAREKLQERGLLGVRQEDPLKLLYIQKPLQQLRTKGAFESVFDAEVKANKVVGISYTTDYAKEANTPSDIVAEYFRIIANHQKKTAVGLRKIGDWEMKGGLNSIAGNHWAYALLLFKELTPEEKQKLVDEMRANIKNMGIDDRTVLYKDLPKEAKGLAKEIYEYRSASSPVVTTMEEGRQTQDEVGGIDMNNIDVNRQGGGVDIQFDPAQLQDIIDAGIDGFAPVIINITPLPSVLPLLGLEPAIKEESTELSLSST